MYFIVEERNLYLTTMKKIEFGRTVEISRIFKFQRKIKKSPVYSSTRRGARRVGWTNSQLGLRPFLIPTGAAQYGYLGMVSWVPGHPGIKGNERAGAVANKAATFMLIGPQPYYGIPRSTTYHTMWVRSGHEQRLR